MKKFAFVLLGVALGAALTIACDRALHASAQAPVVKARAVHAAPHPYTGAKVCTMTGAHTVACDNGYRGPVL